MLTHKYQNWYTQLTGLSTQQWYGLFAIMLLLAGLSLIRPQFFKILTVSCLKALWRGIKQIFSTNGTEERGIYIAGEFMPDEARLRHTHLVGGTGTGKTVTAEQIIYEDIARGHGALIIDPKGDRELYDRIRDFCRSIGREKHLHFLSASWTEESVRWNPCSVGNASELQSKWFNSGTYNEPFYAKACELGLLEAFNALLDDQPQHFTVSDLVNQLKRQAGDSKQQTTAGLFIDLQAFAKSEWGPVLCVPEGVTRSDRPIISLLEITSRNEILFVDLPTEAKAVQSARVGKLILQEMMLISGLRKLHPELKSNRPFSIFVDEFDAFATENFATFQNKGRSSGFMIHLAHQTLSDLEKVSKTFKGQIMGNCNVRFIFRQDDPDDAETWSKFLGTKKTMKRTIQTEHDFSTGRASNREVEEFRVHPNEIKDLGVGECIFSMKSEGVIKRLRIQFPSKWPKRFGGVLEREAPKSAGVTGKCARRPEEFDRVTNEQGSLLEEARKSKQETNMETVK